MMVYVATVQYEGVDERRNSFVTHDVIGVFHSETIADEALTRARQTLIKQGYENVSTALWHKYIGD